MKKLLAITAFFLGLLAFLYLSPHFLKLDKIQDQITVKVNQALGMEVSIGEVSLHWFPYPHLFIGEVQARNDKLSVQLPRLRAVPDWKSLLHKQLVLGKIKIIDPVVEIKSIPEDDNTTIAQMVNLDRNFEVEIENASISLPEWIIYDSTRLKKNTFSNLNANLTFENNRIKYDLSGKASFCGEIASTGRIDFNNSYYRIDFFYKNFNFFTLTESISEKICPVDQLNNFSAHLEGVTTKNFKLRLKGNLPAFELNEITSLTVDNDHVSEISIEKYDDDFFINFNKFQFNYPKLELNGKISRRYQQKTALPIWNLDLIAQDLDLNQAREFVLNLWGENKIAQIVCNIVQGGKANSARYVFSGPAADFEHISAMEIWVDVANAPILIPEIDLQLDGATGSISILDGVLSGDNLTAEISSSSGSNGSLLLDLKDDATAFQLDLDLDIDVAKLKDVLENIVDEPGFQKELTHFKDLTGRAKGHLSLGDNLDDLNTTVEVKEIKANGVYDRLPWPFSIQSGSLTILPGKTKWESVEATLGPHHIFKNSAQVSWEDQAVIMVENFKADIDGLSFFKEGNILIGEETYTSKDFFSPYLTGLNGIIRVSNAQLSGPAITPSAWEYQADLEANNIALHSPHLPGKISLNQSSATIGSDKISLSTKAKLLNDSFQLMADYKHKNLTYWQGETLFSGTINQQLIDWLDSKKVIPPAFQFKTPLFAEEIKLSTEGNSLNRFKLSGKVIADKDGADQATLELDINRLKNQFQNNISFSSKKEAGKLVYNLWDGTPQKTLLTWKGALSNNTFDSFFSRHPFTSGKVNGVFSLLKSKTDTDTPSYSGYIEANNLQWQSRKGTAPFVIDTLLLNGNEDNIQISKSNISFQQGGSASLSGSIVTDTKYFDMDLELTSKELTSKSIEAALSFFKNKIDGLAPPPSTDILLKDGEPGLPIVSGIVEFSIDNFIYSTQETSPQSQNDSRSIISEEDLDSVANQDQDKSFPWTQITGEAVFADKDMQIDFLSAQLCGIEVSGQWISKTDKTNANYYINDTEQLSFQQTLPCLGINQSVIEGDFRLGAELSGTPDNWKKGKLTITSPNGIIRRMEILSNIFSVVNFTEFLTFKDLPDMDTEGLQYNDLVLESHIDQHKLIIDKAFLKGKGLNLTGQGSVDFKDATTDLTVFVAPFKMLDSVVTSIPLVGRIVGGKKGAILTFPVRVKGPIGDPSVTPLSPTAIGKATLDFITDTLTLPFAIFTPFMKDEEQESVTE